jgi:hypothetical protein
MWYIHILEIYGNGYSEYDTNINQYSASMFFIVVAYFEKDVSRLKQKLFLPTSFLPTDIRAARE